jgi:CRP-like cAMP-binding protein
MSWALLAGLAPDARAEVLEHTGQKDLARGEALFWEGDPAEAVYLIERGHVSVRVCTPAGDEAIVRVLGPADHVGELALLAAAARSTSAVALDAVRVRVLHRADFARLRDRHPEVEHQILEALVTETNRLAGALTDSYFLSVADRTVRRLVELAGVFGGSGGEVVVPLTQDELAQLAGTARPTVNKVLRDLQADGLVRVSRGRVLLCDVSSLRDRARAPARAT